MKSSTVLAFIIVLAIAAAMATRNELQGVKLGRNCYTVRTPFCRGRNLFRRESFEHENGDTCRCIRLGIGACKRSPATTTTSIPSTTIAPVATEAVFTTMVGSTDAVSTTPSGENVTSEESVSLQP